MFNWDVETVRLTLYFPSPTWKTLNFCLQVHWATCRLISSSILSVSVSGPRSSQSGLNAAMNSLEGVDNLVNYNFT